MMFEDKIIEVLKRWDELHKNILIIKRWDAKKKREKGMSKEDVPSGPCTWMAVRRTAPEEWLQL
jgi:hypothetical protein